jgi:release factor glutamine methyltransferase
VAGSYKSHWTTSLFLWPMRRHRSPYDVSYGGRKLRVFPGVLSPRYDWSGKFGVECLPPTAGKSFLEIGPGCGIVSLFAALAGARMVVSVEVSPVAVCNTKCNFDRHGLSNAHVVRGDLFDCISGQFDIIFFNAPFHGSPAGDWLERAVCDEDYDALKRFIAGVRARLTADGVVMLGYSKIGDEGLLHSELDRAGLSVASCRERRKWGYSCRYYVLRVGSSPAPPDR